MKVRVLNHPQSAGVCVYAPGILTLRFKQYLLFKHLTGLVRHWKVDFNSRGSYDSSTSWRASWQGTHKMCSDLTQPAWPRFTNRGRKPASLPHTPRWSGLVGMVLKGRVDNRHEIGSCQSLGGQQKVSRKTRKTRDLGQRDAALAE